MIRKILKSSKQLLPQKFTFLALLIFISLISSYSVLLAQNRRNQASNQTTGSTNKVSNSEGKTSEINDSPGEIKEIDKRPELAKLVDTKLKDECKAPGNNCYNLVALKFILDSFKELPADEFNKLTDDGTKNLRDNCLKKFEPKGKIIPEECQSGAKNILNAKIAQTGTDDKTNMDNLPKIIDDAIDKKLTSKISLNENSQLFLPSWGAIVLLLFILVFLLWQEFFQEDNTESVQTIRILNNSVNGLSTTIGKIDLKVNKLVKIAGTYTIETSVEKNQEESIVSLEDSATDPEILNEESPSFDQQNDYLDLKSPITGKIEHILNQLPSKFPLVQYPLTKNTLKQRSNDSETTYFFLVKEISGQKEKYYAIPCYSRIGKETEFSTYKDFYETESKTFSGELEIIEPAEIRWNKIMQGWVLIKPGKIRFV